MEANILNPEIWKPAEGDRKAQWMLQTSIIVQTCWQNQNGKQSVGDLVCEGGYEWNETISNWTSWGSPQGVLGNLKNWTNGSQIPLGWPAPDGYYWICGKIAYTKLPKNWAGSGVSGTIRPSFFLLPITRGERLGVPVYIETEELRSTRRSLQIGNWKKMNGPQKG